MGKKIQHADTETVTTAMIVRKENAGIALANRILSLCNKRCAEQIVLKKSGATQTELDAAEAATLKALKELDELLSGALAA